MKQICSIVFRDYATKHRIILRTYSIILLFEILFLESDFLFLAFDLFLLPSMANLYNFIMLDLSKKVWMCHPIDETDMLILIMQIVDASL